MTNNKTTHETAPVSPGYFQSSDSDYAFAQATMVYGENQLLDLDRQATEISLNMDQSDQAANAAALSTQEYNQRQQADLDYQATIVSLNITQAAATQENITRLTEISGDSTVVAKSTVVAATRFAFLVNVTQTAEAQAVLDLQTANAQAILDAQILQATQAAAALTAYPLTATPFAITEAALLMQQYDREQRAFESRITTFFMPILVILAILLLIIAGIVLAYFRFMPQTWLRRKRITSANIDHDPFMIEGEVVEDHNSHLHRIMPPEFTSVRTPRLPSENTAHVEIVNASKPPVVHWVAEVENQLLLKGWLR